MANIGRPSDYTDETADTICKQLCEGKSLRAICKDEALPCESTVYLWLNEHPAFSEKYACARKTWADAQIEEILTVAKDGEKPSDQKRVEIDTIKWAMGKLNGKYSDKVKHVGGDDDDAPIRTESKATIDARGLTDEQLRVLASIPVPPE